VDPLIMLAGNNNNKKSAVLHLKKCQVSLKSPKILAFLSFYTNSNCHTYKQQWSKCYFHKPWICSGISPAEFILLPLNVLVRMADCW